MPETRIGTPVLLLMALASGLCVGGNYFNQPLLHSIALDLDVSEATASFTVTVAQLSYALGLLLLVPLGDMLERRGLAVGLMLLAALGQFTSGWADSIVMLCVGVGFAGLFSVAAQVLVPMAAALSDPARSGRAVGLVMSGLLTGILAARSVAGLLSDYGGWTTVYRVSGGLMLLVALVLWRVLPASRNPQRIAYGEVLGSMLTLLSRYPRLRSRALLAGLSFASVSGMFATMALLLSGTPHLLGDAAIGLIGLTGAAGALTASLAGRWADRGWLQMTTGASVLLLALSFLPLWLGATSLPAFVLGFVVIDAALQGIHISNQTVVYGLLPEARGRLNAVYMTAYFIGAALGSAAGSLAWQWAGWPGVCGLGLAMALSCGLAWWWDLRLARAGR